MGNSDILAEKAFRMWEETTLQSIEDLRISDPKLLEYKFDLLRKEKEEEKEELNPIKDTPEMREEVFFARLKSHLKRTGCPQMCGFTPVTIRNTSEEATCYTKFEDDLFKKWANLDPHLVEVMVFNPKTGLPDEEFTASVIKRYREDPCVSSVTAMATSFDHVDLGESSATTVVDASSNN
ncbi:uncharacterized protein [Rutidosis leptorrhynchoides]|uniref:uncharacterized protein n=1 Tax=Rutidosis leptorrhynchoides TaxID=125765 RepID=UPI003A9A6698